MGSALFLASLAPESHSIVPETPTHCLFPENAFVRRPFGGRPLRARRSAGP